MPPIFEMTLLTFVGAILVGVLFWNTIAGRFEGDRLERSLRIPVGVYYLHVHHWLYCLCIMSVLYGFGFHRPWAYGLLCGSVVQGLTYRDWRLLMYRKRDAEAIYAKWKSLPTSVRKCEI